VPAAFLRLPQASSAMWPAGASCPPSLPDPPPAERRGDDPRIEVRFSIPLQEGR